LIQEPENDDRYNFSGGEHITASIRLVPAEKYVVMPAKRGYVGTGLPNCFLENPRTTIAETGSHQDSNESVTAGMVFQIDGNGNCLILGGLARPTKNDVYLYFLAGHFEVSC
jgi:hypothetical protein